MSAPYRTSSARLAAKTAWLSLKSVRGLAWKIAGLVAGSAPVWITGFAERVLNGTWFVFSLAGLCLLFVSGLAGILGLVVCCLALAEWFFEKGRGQ